MHPANRSVRCESLRASLALASRAASNVRRVSWVAALLVTAMSLRAQAKIDFNTQIRPILNQNCTSCHGGVKAAGEISFVYRETATKLGKKSGRPVIVPGKPEESELIARVTSADKDYRMPPADHGAALPKEKIDLLREWIRQGAEWQEHWAFVPPKLPPVPQLQGSGGESVPAGSASAKPIDAFVRARLAKEGLSPSPEAPRAALLRRVSLDLIGLPPSPEEIETFVNDPSPTAFERQVDRLLASPHFGERWASLWLDLARYADTKGYEKDDNRTVWKYRDWVVDAFNRNLPYDRFVIEQLAGDLLPGATIDQHIATGFHRQTQVNDEGGTDDEEYRIAAVIDRVGTTWQVVNAVTFNCVQCHSHPYDPIRHKEYYQFFSVLNGTRDADYNDDHPTLRVPKDPAQHEAAWRLRQEIDAMRRDVVAAGKSLAADAKQWRAGQVANARVLPDTPALLRDGEVIVDGTVSSHAKYELTLPVFALTGQPLTALRLEARPVDEQKARHTPERGFVITQVQLALATPDGTVQPLEVGRFFPDTDHFTTPATKQVPKSEAQIAAEAAADQALAVAAGGSPASAGKKSGKSGPPMETRDVTLDFHFSANPTISGPRWVVAALKEPLVAPPGSTLKVTLTHGFGITSKPAPIRRLRVQVSSDERWSRLARDPEIGRKAARVTDALAELARMPGIDLPVTAELPPHEARETRLFARGNFLEKIGEPLAPGVPELFPRMAPGTAVNRLTVAQWFFQPGQPLTARVAVNRFWEQLFGRGIVATLEDFGSVGEAPSHPELLDWLALRFERDLKWNMKALLREIVTSATYRQDGRITPEGMAKDPQNRFMARGPRQRLTAEMVRDQALTASGLLSRKMGGEPVMPPQPAGVWQTVYNNKDWVTSKGDDQYRRALYTFWKRSAAYPGFLTFDMPARDLCTARRTPTNTPLQALVTLNDVVYNDAAAGLAARAAREVGESVDAQIARAFELVISRAPTAAELKRLRALHDQVGGATAGDKPMRDVAIAILNLDAAFVR
jgi:hypothetical protein